MNNFGIDKTSFDEIIKVFESLEELNMVILFGSRARGDYKKTSDIDIAIKCNANIKSKLIFKLDEVRCILKFDVVNIDEINEKLLENIKKDGVIIYKKIA